MELLSDSELEESDVVANCNMNRERNLRGSNGYERDLRFDPLAFLRDVEAQHDNAKWLDLCCGTGKALIEAAAEVDKESLSIEIIGVDLVGMFDSNESASLTLVEASLSLWQPPPQCKFDLITCVHGLHYIGDKLQLIERSLAWLSPIGTFAANLDRDNLKLENGDDSELIDGLRHAGFSYSALQKLLRSDGIRNVDFALEYLGADPEAGPNYTGQPAVNSWYRKM
ncbi:methyltransferase domain-containing protein [Mariniblastus fucicola]|nr:methyltransferase domain-containing protein [Mariniblastus fucicola]